ncbi:MAG: TIGR04283 family arsenosugar biosynthesis glycosyltransferase [Acidobacteriota bacterium]|nr:TIGR04283 family arsenosugar biosynthesis glycosyltransferase [Acidobacteriota bacterium]MDH3528157.1 TIGR04283 family arsenosugar biosynthesis glycosyltransferase [Acidobacteriota bacterium]
MNKISVITPTYNEEKTIVKTLESVSRLISPTEIIIVDGGSEDSTAKLIEEFKGPKPIKFVDAGLPNRGFQMHEGTRHATGDVYWFIHADTRPRHGSGAQILRFVKYEDVVGGHFEIIFSGRSRAAKFLTWLYPNLRRMGLVYGDSAFFVKKSAYEKVGGFEEYPLFEDFDLYRKLKKLGEWRFIPIPVETSSRRFEQRYFPWVFTKWALRQVLFWLGVPPRLLARTYRVIR